MTTLTDLVNQRYIAGKCIYPNCTEVNYVFDHLCANHQPSNEASEEYIDAEDRMAEFNYRKDLRDRENQLLHPKKDPTITSSHVGSLGCHSSEVTGRGIGLLLNHLNLCNLHILSFTLHPGEVSVVLYQEEVQEAAEDLHIYTPDIPLQKWADHFLAIALTTAERQLALETQHLSPA